MAVNFAPYQSSPPESTRALSPPLRSPTASPKPTKPTASRNISSVADREDPWAAARNQPLASPSAFADQGYSDLESGPRQDYVGSGAPVGSGNVYTGGMDVFETSLGIKINIEACLAYLLLPPAGGVVLLVFEHKSDYVRYVGHAAFIDWFLLIVFSFHAWQSSLLFTFLFIVHIIFSWTSIISWMLFAIDLMLIAYLAFHAYRNAETLDRLEVPFFGRLASSFVDDE